MTPALPTRFVNPPGTFNFRDLGGYPGHGGRTVRRRRVYRSDRLDGLTPEGRTAFAALGVRTVIDLRRAGERQRGGWVPDGAGVSCHSLPAHLGLAWREYDPERGLIRFVADRCLRTAERSTASFGAALRLLAEARNAPAVLHCHAGRDRTGVLAALLLGLLGVAEETIAEDYALSSVAEERYNSWLRATGSAAEIPPAHLVATPREAMLLFLRELRDRHDGPAGYAAAAGLGGPALAALRDHLLAAPGSPCGSPSATAVGRDALA